MFLSNATAGGTIYPARFVKALTTADNQVVQAADGDSPMVGISQRGTRRTPLEGLDDGYAALSGEGLQVFQLGQIAPLEIGTVAVAAGDLLMSDANGKGIVATAGKYYGAQIAQAAGAGKIVEVKVLLGQLNA